MTTGLEALVVAAYVFADYRIPGCQRRSEFAGFARFGLAKSPQRFVYGVRLLTDQRGAAAHF